MFNSKLSESVITNDAAQFAEEINAALDDLSTLKKLGMEKEYYLLKDAIDSMKQEFLDKKKKEEEKLIDKEMEKMLKKESKKNK